MTPLARPVLLVCDAAAVRAHSSRGRRRLGAFPLGRISHPAADMDTLLYVHTFMVLSGIRDIADVSLQNFSTHVAPKKPPQRGTIFAKVRS